MTIFPKTLQAVLCILTFSAVLGLLGNHAQAANAIAVESYVPPGTLVSDQTKTLPIAPSKVVALDEAVYVIGAVGSQHQVHRLNANTLENVGTQDLPFTAQDMVVNFHEKSIYVLGIQDGKSQLAVLDAALELLGELTFEAEIAYPTLSLAKGNILLVAGVRTKQADGALVIVDVTKPAEPAIYADPIPNFYKSMGMTNVWLDNGKQKTVFAHVGTLPTLGAFGVNEKGVVQHSDISFGIERLPDVNLERIWI